MPTISERKSQPIKVVRKVLFCLFLVFPVLVLSKKNEAQCLGNSSSTVPPRILRGSFADRKSQ